MFLRFFSSYADMESGTSKTGFFQVAINLRNSEVLDTETQISLISVIDWFNENLEEPTRFSNGSGKNLANQAICWFRDSSTECIRQAFEMKRILEVHGICVETVWSDNPWYVVYEDEDQIAVIPYRENVLKGSKRL